MVQGVEHIALCAENIVSLIAWYQNIFQLKLVKESPQGPFFLKFPDGVLIEFVETVGDIPEVPHARDKGLRHIAVSVSSIETMVARLKREGVDVVEDFKTVTNGTKLFLFRDVEGNIVQLIERKNPLGA